MIITRRVRSGGVLSEWRGRQVCGTRRASLLEACSWLLGGRRDDEMTKPCPCSSATQPPAVRPFTRCTPSLPRATTRSLTATLLWTFLPSFRVCWKYCTGRLRVKLHRRPAPQPRTAVPRPARPQATQATSDLLLSPSQPPRERDSTPSRDLPGTGARRPSHRR